MNTKQMDAEYIAATYRRFDVVFKSGKGSLVYDEAGKEYIDLGAGIAVTGFGLCDEGWAEAVCAQARKLQHVSNLYYTEPQAQLAKELCQRAGMKKVFFSNSGAEANECLIKGARKYASDRYNAARPNIVTLKNSFHGRTITTLSATGQEAFHKDFGPFTPGFRYAEPNDFNDFVKQVAGEDVAAVLLEMVQGEGGVIALDPAYVTAVYQYAHEHDILFCVDEVQTGNGRTGALYAYMNYGVTPDIVSTAKGLAGGLPMGATLFSEKTKDVLDAGSHGSTFGGNPVCAAAALNLLSRIDEPLLAEVKAKSEWILSALTGAPGVKSVSGMGLMLGIETEKPAGEVVKACLWRGVVCLTAKTKVRLLPALNIPFSLLKQAVTVLKEEIAK